MEKVKGVVMEDRISELPELILSCFISKLPLKDVIKTSALSKSWNKQHRELIHQLSFDLSNIFETKYDKHKFSLQDYNFFWDVRVEFINRVNEVLHHFKKGSSKIKSFKVCFYMECFFSSDVDNWISSAIAFGVEDLQLLFSSQPFLLVIREEHRLYRFPYSFFKQKSSLKHLFLQNCILRPPSDFTGFTKLLTLRLEDVTLGQDFTASLFNMCTILQELIFIACKFPPSSILRVVSTSLCKLSLLNNLWEELKVEISAINLISFEYKPFRYNADVTLFHAPRLAKFYFYKFQQGELPHLLYHLTSVPNLEIISYTLYPDQAKKLLSASLLSFRNLKQLSLCYLGDASTEQDFIWVLHILKASPLLQKLQLTLHYPSFPESQNGLEELCGCTHNSLKQMEMGGCTGKWHEIDFILFILKNAIALERLIIHPSIKIYNGDEKWILVEPEPSWFQSGRGNFYRSLQNDVPKSVQLVIL